MKIVFFVNIIRQARCIRRIEDFINRGYDIEVYGFDREGDNRSLPNFSHTIIGKVSRSTSYLKRLIMMKSSIEDIVSHHPKDTIYYIFSLDVALAFALGNGLQKKYIYEVSDLMELEVGNKMVSLALTSINRLIIKKSLGTILTSPGFEDYLFPKHKPNNTIIVANKLNKHILNLQKPKKKHFDINNITIGFTGAIRNRAIHNFIEVIGSHFPNIHLKFHGIFTDDKEYSKKIQRSIAKYNNISYLGPFKNPDDFPEIYSHIDMVLCLYTSKGNDKVLEPNKLYEAIFFEKPIIVSKDTFTGKYVEEKQIGYAVNGDDINDIISFINSISVNGYNRRVANCSAISKQELIDDTDHLFNRLNLKIK